MELLQARTKNINNASSMSHSHSLLNTEEYFYPLPHEFQKGEGELYLVTMSQFQLSEFHSNCSW